MPERATTTRAAIVGLALAVLPLAARAAINDQDFSQIERGRYLTVASDCAACHTLPSGAGDFAGGRVIETPFGNLLSPNITPDRETGIGAWTDDEFVNALTKGTGRNGKHLYPAMPYTYLTKLTHADALAIRAYLNTLAPVRDPVRSNQLPFPFNIRASMIGWNALFFDPGTFAPVAGQSAQWNLGAYLVEGPMHCGMCHTPKNLFGSDRRSERFKGYSLQGWFAPDITNDGRKGLGAWSTDDIVAYLKTGHNRFAAASGPMGEEVARSSSKMTASDLSAVATYLKGSRGVEAPPSPPAAIAAGTPEMKEGAAIYADECSACHAPNGGGVAGLFPALSGSASVQSREPTSLIRVVLRGARSVATDDAPTAPAMPAFGWLLSNDEVAAVTTYIRNAWGNAAPAVSASEVAGWRQKLVERSD